MFKKKKKWSLCEFQKLVGADVLVDKIQKIEIRIKQLECSHDYKFNRYNETPISKWVFHKCPMCGKEAIKEWDRIAKKEQQALKLLNLVPKSWAIKGGQK